MPSFQEINDATKDKCTCTQNECSSSSDSDGESLPICVNDETIFMNVQVVENDSDSEGQSGQDLPLTQDFNRGIRNFVTTTSVTGPHQSYNAIEICDNFTKIMEGNLCFSPEVKHTNIINPFFSL